MVEATNNGIFSKMIYLISMASLAFGRDSSLVLGVLFGSFSSGRPWPFLFSPIFAARTIPGAQDAGLGPGQGCAVMDGAPVNEG